MAANSCVRCSTAAGYIQRWTLADVDGAGLFAAKMYVACFSKHRDALSQWRAYADDGLGYAIGFKPSWRVELGPDVITPVPVVYEREKQEGLVTHVAEPVLQSLESWTPESSGGKWPHAAWLLSGALQRILPLLKSPGFIEEGEWRAILAYDNLARVKPDGFRATRFGLTPYIELPAPDGELLPIVEVVTGPKIDRRAGSRALADLLRASGYQPFFDPDESGARRMPNAVHVRPSETSYR